MKKAYTIYSQGEHRWHVTARDPDRPGYVIDTNEYLVSHGEHGLLTDPGGMEIFPAVFAAISAQYNPEHIEAIFASHQDPDIISSLALWLEFNPNLRCYFSGLWATFIPHFGGTGETFASIPDEGIEIPLGSLRLRTIPAHYLHSAGNFNLYDPEAKILFSGDLGAALIPNADADLYVADFDRHIRFAEGFHRRWMGSNEAKLKWCERVSSMKINMLCPQHGAIYTGENVARFISWFAELPVGSGNVP